MEGDAVYGEDIVLEVEIVFKNVADEPGEVVVEDEVDRPAARYGARQAFHQAAAKRRDAGGRGRAAPAKDQRDFRFSLF